MSEAGARLRVALADRDRLERCLREMEIEVTLHPPTACRAPTGATRPERCLTSCGTSTGNPCSTG